MERDTKGRFRSGNAGRPRGSRNRATAAVETLLHGEAEAVARALVTAAKAGDSKAGIAILRAVCPPPRGRLVVVDLPSLKSAADAPAALAAVVAAVGSGTLTPTEGVELADLVNAWRLTHETAELEARIAALEAAAESGR